MMTRKEKANYMMAKHCIRKFDDEVYARIMQLRSEAEKRGDLIGYVKFDEIKSDVFSWAVESQEILGWDCIRSELRKVVELFGAKWIKRKARCLAIIEKKLGDILYGHCNGEEWNWMCNLLFLCNMFIDAVDFGEFGDWR